MPIVLAVPRDIQPATSKLHTSAQACDDRIIEDNILPDETRVAALKEILAAKPDDAFARYALGLEYSGSGDTAAALAEFQLLLASHPDYTNGYFMAAQTLAAAGRTTEAIARLKNGIESAERSGDRHAVGEMQAMLDELDR